MKTLERALNPIIQISSEIEKQPNRSYKKEIMVLMVIGEDIQHTKGGQSIT